MNRVERSCLVLGLALTAAVLVVPTTATADPSDPAGTTVLASGPTNTPKSVYLEAVTPTALLFIDERGLVEVDRSTRAATVLTANGDVRSSAGNFVVYQDAVANSTRWLNTATGKTGTAPTTWVAAAPTGGLVVDQPTAGTNRITLQNPVNRTSTVLATVPYTGPPYSFSLRSSATGLLVSYPTDTGRSPATPAYVGYLSYGGGGIQAVDLSGVPSADLSYFSCGAPSSTLVACYGGQDLFAGAPGGSAAVVASGVEAYGVVITKTALVWIEFLGDGADAASYLRSVPRRGGPVTTAASPALSYGVVGDGTSAFESFGTSPDDAGISATPDAATVPTSVVALGAAAERADEIAIGAGRVVWSDNRTPDRPAWQRSLSATPGGVTAGSEQLLTSGASGFGLAVSGLRTGYGFYPSHTYTVVSPVQPTFSASDIYRWHLSGTRLMFEDGNTENLDYALVDLNTGAYRSLATVDPYQSGSLWGDYYTYVAEDGSLVRQSLSSTAAPTTLLKAPPAGKSFDRVQTWGDWAAVSVSSSQPPYARTTLIYNVSTRSKRTLAGDIAYDGATAGGYLVGDTLVSWDGAHSLAVPGSAPDESLTASATAVAWVDGDGAPKVAPIPWTIPDPPRSLGNPLAPTAVAGSTWTFDLPTSAPLSSCSVDLLRGATVIRTLACDTSATGGGDAVVRWDTTTSTGRPAPVGSYTWRVNASNADGPVQPPSGKAGAVTGKFTLTS